MGVCLGALRGFSGAAGAGAAGSARLRFTSKPGSVVGCGSLGSTAGAATGAAAGRAVVVAGVAAAIAGAGTSTLRAPVLRSTLAVSVRAESASADTAGAAGSEGRACEPTTNPSGAFGAG